MSQLDASTVRREGERERGREGRGVVIEGQHQRHS